MKNKKISWLHILCVSAVICMPRTQAKLDIAFDDEPVAPAPAVVEPTQEEILSETPAATTVPVGLPTPEEIVGITEEATAVDMQPAEIMAKPDEALQERRLVQQTESAPQEEEIVVQKEVRKKKKKKKKGHDPLIAFDFKDEKLSNIINLIAAKKEINIVLPQGNNAIKTTVTLDQKGKIPLSRAEQYMFMFLDLAGYTMYPTNGFFVIAPKPENADLQGREPYHLYVNIPPKELPQTSETIRAIYYLSNFQVPQNAQGNDALSAILRDIVGAKKFFFDQKLNAILLYGAADKIASAMNIILELDVAGSPETVTVFPLFYANSDTVANIIQKQIMAVSNKPQGGSRLQIKGETGFYFTPNTRAIADTRTNSVILIGSEAAVTRIKEFVQEYIDVPTESGKSILHLYDLQYLNAQEFAKVLDNLVKQSKAQTQKDKGSGPERFFEDVIITAETREEAPQETAGGSTKGPTGKIILGGNRIIVTAKNDDWVVIKELIEQLDKPQLQVIIEIMVVDITLDGIKEIAAQTRNPSWMGLHDNMQFQTAHIAGQVTSTNPNILNADLLRLLGGSPNTSIAVPASSGLNVGSMIISFKDPCQDSIWSVLQILNSWTQTKVISHPFLVTKNNVTASEYLKTIRRGFGRDVANSGVTTINVEDFSAILEIAVTPRISSLDRLSLQIRVDLENFLSPNPTTFDKATRMVETNATMSPGQILVLGGLIKDTETELVTKWPILGDIPIIGNWFKSTSKGKTKNNLAIFIHPTIVDPKLRAGQQKFTDDQIEQEKAAVSSELFSSNKQPITRLFFGDMRAPSSAEFLDRYLENAHYKKQTVDSIATPSEIAKLENLAVAEEEDIGAEIVPSEVAPSAITAPDEADKMLTFPFVSNNPQ